MEKIITAILFYSAIAMELLGALVLVATIAARFSKGESDDRKVRKYADMFFKFLAYLPTLGINPNTKKLQEAYEDLQAGETMELNQ